MNKVVLAFSERFWSDTCKVWYGCGCPPSFTMFTLCHV